MAQLELSREVIRLSSMLDGLRHDIDRLADSITGETRVQQQVMMDRIQTDLRRSLVDSQRTLADALRISLEKVVASASDRERLFSEFLSATQSNNDTLLRTQARTQDLEGAKMLHTTSEYIVTAFGRVVSEVKDLKNIVERLPVPRQEYRNPDSTWDGDSTRPGDETV